MDNSITDNNNNSSSSSGSSSGSGSSSSNNNNVSLIRTSPFFSLLRLTSQSNLQELLSGSFSEGGIPSNEINELFTQTILSNIASSSPVFKGVLGNATFFETHHRAVKGVDFFDDHIFCSAGLDGKCNIYDARFGRLKSSSIISYQGTVNFNGIKFLTGGNRIALSTSSNKLLIFDVEKAAIVQSYDRCTFSGPFKTSITVDEDNTNMLITPNVSGKGLSQIDIRSPITIKNLDQIHQNTINDIQILNSSWSRYYNSGGLINNNNNNSSSSSNSEENNNSNNVNNNNQDEDDNSNDNNNDINNRNNNNNNSGSSSGVLGSSSTNLILTASSDSTVKIIDNQKNIIKQFNFLSSQHCVTHSPEPPENNGSCITIGGDRLSIFNPDGTAQNSYLIPASRSIMKLAYTNNGTKLFIGNNDGNVRVFNRTNYKHDLVGIVYKHSRDIQDLSVSKNDEYLVTASADSKVGLIRIGDPTFGPSEYGDLL